MNTDVSRSMDDFEIAEAEELVLAQPGTNVTATWVWSSQHSLADAALKIDKAVLVVHPVPRSAVSALQHELVAQVFLQDEHEPAQLSACQVYLRNATMLVCASSVLSESSVRVLAQEMLARVIPRELAIVGCDASREALGIVEAGILLDKARSRLHRLNAGHIFSGSWPAALSLALAMQVPTVGLLLPANDPVLLLRAMLHLVSLIEPLQDLDMIALAQTKLPFALSPAATLTMSSGLPPLSSPSPAGLYV